MDATYLSLFIFSLVTLLYYIFKPKLTLDVLNNGDEAFQNYTKQNYLYLIGYFFLVIISQFFINFGIISNKCGGNLKDNFAAGALMTFIPWVFIFGVVILVLIIFPGFKSAFSNVVGYFAVAGQANTILNELLVNANVQEAINDPSTPPGKKAELQRAAEAIIKLCGNTSIMVNQIVPENFKNYWAILEPLMKDKYQNPTNNDKNKAELDELQSQLLSVVVTRDNIGEALWYSYTALLLISIVQYNLATRGCIMDPKTMAENHQKFVEAEDAKLKSEATSKSQVYAG